MSAQPFSVGAVALLTTSPLIFEVEVISCYFDDRTVRFSDGSTAGVNFRELEEVDNEDE